jgi:hypothetical protein
MTTPHRSRDADAKSAARVIAVIRQEAEARRGTPQGDIWREIADVFAARWPQGALCALPDQKKED